MGVPTKYVNSDTVVGLELSSVGEGTVGPNVFSFDGEVAQVQLNFRKYNADELEHLVRDLRGLETLEDEGKLI